MTESRVGTAFRRRGSILAFLFGLVPIAGVIWVERSQLTALRLEHPAGLPIATAGIAGTILTAAALNHIVTRRLGARITGVESLWLTVVASGLNAVSPARAGAAARAVYFHRRHGLSYAEFSSSLYGYYLLVLLGGGIASMVGSLLLQPVSWTTFAGGSIAVGVALLLGLLPVVGQLDGGRVARSLARFSGGWHTIRSNRRILAWMLALATAQLGSGIVALWASLWSIGVGLEPAEATIIASVGVISTLVAVTPGGLGIYEGTVAVTSGILGNDPTLMVAGALTQRALLLVLLAVFAPIASWRLAVAGGADQMPT